MTTLTSLIDEANSSGWAVTLRQHPDAKAYWECALSRPVPTHHENGIVRETVFNIGRTPYEALDMALAHANQSSELIPSGLASAPAPNLLALLNLPARAPTITRR